jgi:MYXO-CTERM domain-containing protein
MPPPPHDACGADGGVFRGGDAGVGDYVFSEPVAAPVQGARWEPACSASPASPGSSALVSMMGLVALGLVTRRRAR